jgi:hypothetical protein
MMSKSDRADLTKTLTKNSGKPATRDLEKPKPKAREKGYVQPSHENAVVFSVHVHTAAKAQLKVIAAETGRTVQDIANEALNLIFAAHGRPLLAVVRDGSSDTEERLKKLWKATK